ncbi:MAG: hypothetical protein NT030_00955, partial [Candidatus Saganbacteria bacterium]|nr:hypothetical protein [Candidatus Saganbacteria bacterium]
MFIAESAKGLYSDIASQVKFILGAVKEFYPNNVASQIDFTGETVKTLYSNRSSQIKFIEIAIRELCQDNMLLQIYFVEKMTKILSNGDISSQGKFVGELAKVLYCDKFSLIQFILKII